jgi:transposase-like protein
MGPQIRAGIRQPHPSASASLGDKWHLDEVVITIAGNKHWLWRAVDQDGLVLDILVQSRRDKKAANRCSASSSKSKVEPLVCSSPTS